MKQVTPCLSSSAAASVAEMRTSSPSTAASRMMRRWESMVISQSILEMIRSIDCTLGSGYVSTVVPAKRRLFGFMTPARGLEHGRDDAGVAGTATEVPAEHVHHLGLGR